MIDQGANPNELLLEKDCRTLTAAWDHYRRSLLFDASAFDKDAILVGLDEVGRGPLAGPLVACCVVFPSSPPPLPFLRDSKKLTPAERELLAPRILNKASHFGYGVVEADEFGGEINLHHLTFLAMERALEAANLPQNCALLVDGKFPLPSWSGPQRAVIKGDDTSFRIAAASVLAKTYRDQIMKEACSLYPHYGFARNVGYGTAEHRKAILENGPCPLHRKNFLKKLLEVEKSPLTEPL